MKNKSGKKASVKRPIKSYLERTYGPVTGPHLAILAKVLMESWAYKTEEELIEGLIRYQFKSDFPKGLALPANPSSEDIRTMVASHGFSILYG